MKLRSDGTGLFFTFCGIDLLLECASPGVWRLREADDRALTRPGAAQTLAQDLGEMPEDEALALDVTTLPDGFLAKAPDGGSVSLAENAISFRDEKGALRRQLTRVGRGREKTVISLRADPGEHFYGTGERFDSVERRGKRVRVYAVDRWCRTRGNSYIPIPFLLSSNCSAIFLNRFERSEIDACRGSKDALRLVQRYAPLDLYIFITDSPGALLTRYSRLTGFAPMPPSWAFGTLVCRYHPEFGTKEDVYAMARAMEENGFPWEAVILEGFPAFRPERRDELREISRTLHEKGRHVLVYEPCGRFPEESAAAFGLTDDIAVSSDAGVNLRETNSYNRLDHGGRKRMRCVDLTSEKGRRGWYAFWDALVRDIGIDGAKIDFCEQFPDRENVRFADGRDPMAAHHWYPTLYNALRLRHFSERPDGGLVFSRGGGIGAQRYPFVWAGDQRREFFFLRPVLNAALSLGLSGVPFVSWDMAGYRPAYRPYDRLHESDVFLRGLAIAAFSPCIQTHGSVRRPYDFDEKTKAIYRAYARLHDCLRPYLLEQAEVACKTGMPLMRHLFLYDCRDARACGTRDEYMLGCGLLAAPVLTRKNTRTIYLPKGRWTQVFTRETFDGPCEIKNARVPVGAVPVFRLEGAPTETLDACLTDAAPYIDEINRLSSKPSAHSRAASL